MWTIFVFFALFASKKNGLFVSQTKGKIHECGAIRYLTARLQLDRCNTTGPMFFVRVSGIDFGF